MNDQPIAWVQIAHPILAVISPEVTPVDPADAHHPDARLGASLGEGEGTHRAQPPGDAERRQNLTIDSCPCCPCMSRMIEGVAHPSRIKEQNDGTIGPCGHRTGIGHASRCEVPRTVSNQCLALAVSLGSHDPVRIDAVCNKHTVKCGSSADVS